MAQCKATRRDGSPCRGDAANGGDFCVFHDPAKAPIMQAGKLAGGEANARRFEGRPGAPAKGGPVKPWRGLAKEIETLQTAEPVEVAVLIGDTIDQVRTGDISPQIANSIGYLATILVKIHETVELEERLEAVEDYIRRQKLEGG